MGFRYVRYCIKTGMLLIGDPNPEKITDGMIKKNPVTKTGSELIPIPYQGPIFVGSSSTAQFTVMYASQPQSSPP
jgi:hypothetical protein